MADSSALETGSSHQRRAVPSACAEFQEFYRALEADSSISTEDMLELFRDLGVYGHLTEIFTVFSNLRDILEQVQRLPAWQPYLEPVKKWPRLLDWVLSRGDLLQQSSFRPSTTLRNPLVHRCTTSHPLYTLLWTSTIPEQLLDFRLLQGHIVLSHLAKIRNHPDYAYNYRDREKAPYDKVLEGTYRCGLALREISLPESAIAPDVLRPERPPAVFAEQMYAIWEALQNYRKIEKNSPPGSEQSAGDEAVSDHVSERDHDLFTLLRRLDSSKIHNHLRAFCYDVAEAYDLRKRGFRLRVPGRSRERHTVHGYLPLIILQADEIVKADDDPAKRSIRWQRGGEVAHALGRGNAHARRIEEEFDIDSEENIGEEFVEADTDCSLQSQGVPSLLSLALRGKMHAEALQNQIFPWEYDLLTDSALHSLLLRMDSDFLEELEKSEENPSILAECIALLSILLWTGCGLKVARKARMVTSAEQIDLRVLSLREETGGATWLLRIPVPSHESAARHRISGCADVGEQILMLPDVAGASAYWRQLHQHYPAVSKESWFSRSVSRYQKVLQGYLRKVDPSGYLSLTKIEDYLWRRLASSGDLAEADMIVGKRHRLSQVRRFYTTLEISRLAQRYRTVVLQILRELERELPNNAPALPSRGYIGAVYRPQLAAVRDVVARLQEELHSCQDHWRSIAAGDRGSDSTRLWRKHYNAYTLYSWVFFSYATAARASCRPFPQEGVEDLQEGFVVYSDKTTRDRSHVRLLWLPEELLSQLRGQKAFAWSVSESRATAEVLDQGGSSFLLMGKAAQPLCPKVLLPYLKEWFGHALPVNSHRRFCRSYLLELGCPVEVIDAFMGHWFTGESPWSRFSSQSAKAYVQQLRPYLTQMLAELGLVFVAPPTPAVLRNER